MVRALILFCLLGAGLTACDESDTDTRTDQERIVGSWDASEASLNVRAVPLPIRVADLTNGEDEQTFTFQPDGRFTFVFDPAEGRSLTLSALGELLTIPLDQAVRFGGTYTLDTAAKTIRFVPTAFDTDESFQMGYAFRSSALDLTAENTETLVQLFGIASEAAVPFARLIEGGQITYQKAGA